MVHKMTKNEFKQRLYNIIKNNINDIINYSNDDISPLYNLCYRYESDTYYNLFYQSKDKQLDDTYINIDVYIYKDKKHTIEILIS